MVIVSLIVLFYGALNLNYSLLFFFKSFYTCFLSLKKHQKRPAPAKSVITAFCSRVASDIPRSAERWSALLWGAKAPVVATIAHSPWSHKQLFVQASGTKQLAFHAITATQQCTAQTYFVLFPLLTRLFAEILMVTVFFEITIVHGKAQRYKVHKKILAAYVIGGQYPFID